VNKNLIYAIVAGIIIVLFGFSAYLLGQNQKLTSQQVKTEAAPTTSVSLPADYRAEQPLSPTPQEEEQETVIIIDSQANLPPSDVDQLNKKIIEPYIHYFQDTRKDDLLVSMRIGVNTGASASTYPYKAEAISKNGVTEGFLISKTGGQIDWWYPECLMKCEFSQEFSTKYPEIVAKY
jgi:hypothetical protein